MACAGSTRFGRPVSRWNGFSEIKSHYQVSLDLNKRLVTSSAYLVHPLPTSTVAASLFMPFPIISCPFCRPTPTHCAVLCEFYDILSQRNLAAMKLGETLRNYNLFLIKNDCTLRLSILRAHRERTEIHLRTLKKQVTL